MLLELLWVLWHVTWVWLLKPLWGAALLLTILSKHAFGVLYWTSPGEGKVQCTQAHLLEGEEMRTPSMSSKQAAAPATPSTFYCPQATCHTFRGHTSSSATALGHPFPQTLTCPIYMQPSAWQWSSPLRKLCPSPHLQPACP